MAKGRKTKRKAGKSPEEIAEELGRELHAEQTAFTSAASSKSSSLIKIASGFTPRGRRRSRVTRPDLSHVERPVFPKVSRWASRYRWFSSCVPEPSTNELEDMETRARARYNYYKYSLMTLALPVMGIGAILGIIFGIDHAMELFRFFLEGLTSKTPKFPR